MLVALTEKIGLVSRSSVVAVAEEFWLVWRSSVVDLPEGAGEVLFWIYLRRLGWTGEVQWLLSMPVALTVLTHPDSTADLISKC